MGGSFLSIIVSGIYRHSPFNATVNGSIESQTNVYFNTYKQIMSSHSFQGVRNRHEHRKIDSRIVLFFARSLLISIVIGKRSPGVLTSINCVNENQQPSMRQHLIVTGNQLALWEKQDC